MSERQKQEVVIIGAGPAGLSAAYELLKESANYQVTILEASQDIGGISKTVTYKGKRMDIGGHRFFSKDEGVMEWWRDVLPLQGVPSRDDLRLNREVPLENGGPDPEKEDRVMLVRKRISRIYYKKKFFDYPISMKPQTFLSMGLLQTIKAGFSYLGACIKKRPEHSLEDFYVNRFGSVLYRMFFEGYTEKLWGRHPREISAEWGAQRVKGLSILALLKNVLKKGEKETSLIEEFWYPKLGPGQLWECVAKEVEEMGGTIIKGACVEQIALKESQVSHLTYLEKEGKQKIKKEADILISSMPLKDLVTGMTGDLPEGFSKIRDIATGLPYRDFITVGLLVDKLELKNETKIKTLQGLIPDCWIYVQDTGVKLGRIQIFNNWSPYLVGEETDKIWIGLEYFCQEGDEFWSMSDEECSSFAMGELIYMGVIASMDAVKDWHRKKVKKAYPAYFDTYSQIDELTTFLNGIENLYCVGRNGQHRYNNMDHSMATSFQAVSNILHKKKDKSNIWTVNTEKTYHEKK